MMIGDAFKAKREASGLTQAAAAQQLYTTQPFIAQIEAGVKMPSVGMVKLAAELFDCTTDELIFGERRGA